MSAIEEVETIRQVENAAQSGALQRLRTWKAFTVTRFARLGAGHSMASIIGANSLGQCCS
jgi:hypothetical protein